MELNIETQAKGTRIIFGDEAIRRRLILNKLIDIANMNGFFEVDLPVLELSQVYRDKAGDEILNQMYIFKDKGERDLCLRPEGTATIQLLADKYWKEQKDVKLWYFTRCYRYERPQAGRYREFFQFGVEVINPRSTSIQDELIDIAKSMIETVTSNFEINSSVKRGLNYYTDNGFEIVSEQLGAQKQICGGGRYKQGIGFAIGFDRLMLL